MDEKADPTRPTLEQPTPEVAQLLRLLELQSAARRERQPLVPKSFHGATFRWGSLIAIIIFAIGSIVVMEWMLAQLPRPVSHAAVTPASPAR